MSASVSRREALFSLAALARTRLLRGQGDTTFSAEVKIVNVLATVRDKKGQIVRNLTKDDFILSEDDRPQTIRYFSQEAGLPLTLGLLIDTSGSQRRVLGLEKDASYQFLDQVLREDKDLAFVIHFDREVELLQDLTSSRKKLESTLDSLDTPGFWPPRGGQRPPGGGYPGGGRPGGGYPGRRRGGTSLYDAVFLASDELMKKQSGRKAVIALTDGVDNGSRTTLMQSIESAARADTLVYAVLFADPGAYGGFGGRRMGGRRGQRFPAQRTDGKKILVRMAKETGGGFFEVSQKQPIGLVFSRIEEDLRHQYSIGYTSDGTGDGYRKIHLAAKQKGLIVQARDGYYPRQAPQKTQ